MTTALIKALVFYNVRAESDNLATKDIEHRDFSSAGAFLSVTSGAISRMASVLLCW